MSSPMADAVCNAASDEPVLSRQKISTGCRDSDEYSDREESRSFPRTIIMVFWPITRHQGFT
jgi:hypothetical protein